jgi:hypothetical protein
VTLNLSPSDEPSSDRLASERTGSDKFAPNLAQIDEPGGFGGLAARIVVAAVVISIGIGAYFYFGRGKPVATGDIARISIYPIHTVTSGQGSEAGMAGQDETYDQLLVFAQVHVQNLSPDPLTITEIVGNIMLPTEAKNGEGEPTSRAASLSDFNRLFSAYPKLAPLRMDPLLRDTVIPPGQSAEGLLLFNYSMSKDAWDQRKRFSIEVSFKNGTVIHINDPHA